MDNPNTRVPDPELVTPAADVYTRAELMESARAAFGVFPEVVAGALALAHRTNATKEEAVTFIKNFLAREV